MRVLLLRRRLHAIARQCESGDRSLHEVACLPGSPAVAPFLLPVAVSSSAEAVENTIQWFREVNGKSHRILLLQPIHRERGAVRQSREDAVVDLEEVGWEGGGGSRCEVLARRGER
jgi:hypothetical protein